MSSFIEDIKDILRCHIVDESLDEPYESMYFARKRMEAMLETLINTDSSSTPEDAASTSYLPSSSAVLKSKTSESANAGADTYATSTSPLPREIWVAIIYAQLGRNYVITEEVTEGVSYLLKALRVLRTRLDVCAVQVMELLNQLAMVYTRRDLPARARLMLLRALQIFERDLNPRFNLVLHPSESATEVSSSSPPSSTAISSAFAALSDSEIALAYALPLGVLSPSSSSSSSSSTPSRYPLTPAERFAALKSHARTLFLLAQVYSILEDAPDGEGAPSTKSTHDPTSVASSHTSSSPAPAAAAAAAAAASTTSTSLAVSFCRRTLSLQLSLGIGSQAPGQYAGAVAQTYDEKDDREQKEKTISTEQSSSSSSSSSPSSLSSSESSPSSNPSSSSSSTPAQDTSPSPAAVSWARNAYTLAEAYVRRNMFIHADACLRAASAALGYPPASLTVSRGRIIQGLSKPASSSSSSAQGEDAAAGGAKPAETGPEYAPVSAAVSAAETALEVRADLARSFGAFYASWLSGSLTQMQLDEANHSKEDWQWIKDGVVQASVGQGSTQHQQQQPVSVTTPVSIPSTPSSVPFDIPMAPPCLEEDLSHPSTLDDEVPDEQAWRRTVEANERALDGIAAAPTLATVLSGTITAGSNTGTSNASGKSAASTSNATEEASTSTSTSTSANSDQTVTSTKTDGAASSSLSPSPSPSSASSSSSTSSSSPLTLAYVLDREWFPQLQPLLGSARDFPVIKDVTAARAAAKQGLRYCEEALKYYVVDGYVTEHLAVTQEMSLLYRSLAHYEEDASTKCKLLKRRIDLVEPLLKTLSPKVYFDYVLQFASEAAHCYAELMDFKMDIEVKKASESNSTTPTLPPLPSSKSSSSSSTSTTSSSSDNSSPSGVSTPLRINASALVKVNNLATNAVKYFNYWYRLLPPKQPTLGSGEAPRTAESASASAPSSTSAATVAKLTSLPIHKVYEVDEEYHQPFVSNALYVARVYSRMRPPTKEARVLCLQESLREYQRLIDFVQVNKCEKRFKSEVEVALDMIQLMPLQLKRAATIDPAMGK